MKSRKRNCLSKNSTGKILTVLSSGVEFLSEGTSTALTVYTMMGNSSPTEVKVPVAISVGAVTGTVHSISNFCFQGPVIRKFLSDKVTEDSEPNEAEFSETISTQKKTSYFFLKYGYSLFAPIVAFFELYLYYSATKAWINDLYENEDTQLITLNITEVLLLLLYFFVMDFLFLYTNDVYQSCADITKRFRISKYYLPDQTFLEKIRSLVKPIASSYILRKFIRFSGSLSDTFYHLDPCFDLVPAAYILDLAKQPLIYSLSIGIIAGLFLAIITFTIFFQTYLFEGKYSKENLEDIAWENLESVDRDEAWINPKFSRFFHKLLYLGAIIHAVDTLFSIILALRELEVNPIVNYAVGLFAFIIAGLSNYFSEVKESQESLKKITKAPMSELVTGTGLSQIFRMKSIDFSKLDLINNDDSPAYLAL